MNLQPEWRQGAVGKSVHKAPVPGEKWTRTYIGGKNGIFMLVVTLAWWISKLDGKLDDGQLALAVDDVKWVLGAMMVANETGYGGGDTRGDMVALGEKRPAVADELDDHSDNQVPLRKR